MTDPVLVHRELMVRGAVDRAIVHLGAPAACAALLQAGFLIVDAFWLGRVGPVALAAASTAGFVMWLAQAVGDGIAVGSGARLARAVGAGDPAAARRAAAAGQALALAASVVVATAGLLAAGDVFAFMGTDDEVTAAGWAYLRVILVGLPAHYLFAWAAASFRAAGDARTPVRLLVVASAVNVVVDPLLIFGAGPLPPLGTAGAALATALAWTTAAIVGWVKLGGLGLRPRLADLPGPWSESLGAIRVGLPVSLEGALFSLIYILLTTVTTGFGTAALAALGVGHKLEMLNYFVCAGMGAAATTLVGQALGAGDGVRAGRVAWRALFLTCLPVGAVTCLLVAFPRIAVAVFSSDREVQAAGVTYALLVGMSQLFMAAEVVLFGAFAGAQRTTLPAVLVVALTALRVPVATWLVARGVGVEAIWLAIGVTTVVKGLVLAGLFAAQVGRGRTGTDRAGGPR